MKYLIFLVFLTSASIIDAQNLRPQSIYASYFGETVTHPGLRVGLNYQLKDWSKTKLMKSGTEKVIQNNMDLSPSIGFFITRIIKQDFSYYLNWFIQERM